MSEKKIQQIKAAGGIVFKFSANSAEPQVLMILRNGVWDLPKGKAEEGESIERCAVREVAEEVGSRLPSIVSNLGTTYHEYKEEEKLIGKTTWWYSMIFTKEENPQPQCEEGIEKVEWVNLPEAIKKVGYETLKPVLQIFGQQKKV